MDYAVDVRALTKVYEGTVRALDGIDLKVEAGTVFALLGPNGAGKTTLMRILTTQLKPTSGEAFVFGRDVVRDSAEIRRLVGYVPQEVSVWTDISGYENLLIYAKIYGVSASKRKEIIKDALKIMGLSEVADNVVKTYSGGLMRRLETACAIVIKPKIMFLDEPTIGLDPSARKAVWEELTSFKKEYGVTVFFNTHYMDEADIYADEIAVINDGKIATRGTAEEFKRSVGGEVILLSADNNVNEDCLDKVRSLSFVNDVIADNSELSVVVKDAETALPDIMEVLRVSCLSAKKISIMKPTLDDVFLKYAGTRLESGGRISDVRQVRGRIRRG
jgi:ABC-2 type transport system ATP-binding protein